jgi:uncharacterized protein YqjF (DUF2071 family)
LQVDTFQGEAYLGIVPFSMQAVRPIGLPPCPGLSWFLELNVRTYVYDRAGVPGVWFYSLDCNQPLAVWGARTFFDLPYFRAQLSTHEVEDEWTYQAQRQQQAEAARYRYRPGTTQQLATPDTLEFFLLERYYLYAQHRRTGKLWRGQVAHRPYRFQGVEVVEESLAPVQWNGGVSLSGPSQHRCWVEGVDVTIYGLEAVND